jgi:hypothetical protein
MQTPQDAGPLAHRPVVTGEVDPALLGAMTSLGHELAGTMDRPGHELAGADRPVQVLAARGESVVVRVGAVVVKAHHQGTDPEPLAVQVALAGSAQLAGILLPPLLPEPRPAFGRWLTVWPFGRTVGPEPDDAPWSAGARLLARLHAVPLDTDTTPLRTVPLDTRSLPSARGPFRTARAVAALAELDDGPDVRAVRAAWQTLPAWARGERPVPGPVRLTHGDWHFGQLVTDPAGRWLLCDVDDLGLGSPLWDLGRPAAFRAIGAVTAEEFAGFLDEYRAAGGLLAAGGDPWPVLDVPARAYTAQTAARFLLKARRAGTALDEVTCELLAACRRMVTVPVSV